MRENALRKLLAGGKKAVNAWCAIPSAFSTEMMSHCGFDSVTLDLQHGIVDYQTAVTMLQAISTTPATPMVRVPWNEPGIMMKLLDAGAYGIVCPMINTKEEAEAFVSNCRYPPRGNRSFGPIRATLYAGADYAQHANEEVLLFAMIETRTALDNLDDILSVEGLDGTYVGPSDLSLSFAKPPTLAPSDPEVLAAMKTICDKTKAAGKFSGVHTDGSATALQRYEDGFQFCTLANDVRLMANAAQAAVREARGEAAGEAGKGY